MKNAPPLPRRIVRSKEEYLSYVKAQNNRTNVYTSVYDFAEFAEKAIEVPLKFVFTNLPLITKFIFGILLKASELYLNLKAA